MDSGSSPGGLPRARVALWALGAGWIAVAGCSHVTVIEILATGPFGGGGTATTSTTGGSAASGGFGASGGTDGGGGLGAMGGTAGTGGTAGSGGVGPTCSNGVQDGTETDIDCGGDTCPPCALCQACEWSNDCQSGPCDPAHHVCTAPWTGVAAGDTHTCGRRGDGSLWCWGGNSNGQLGIGAPSPHELSPVRVTALGGSVAEVSLGQYHSCARRTEGSLWCWGKNDHGQLGDGTTGDKPSPVQVLALGSSVAQVALGGAHGCARKTDGSLWCWGENADGELGNGTATPFESSPVPVAALGTSVAQVAVGRFHTCALTTNGSLWCWGNSLHGQLGDETIDAKSSPVQIVALGASVAQVALGQYHSCARKTDGSLWCWGSDEYGQLGVTGYGDHSSPVQVATLDTGAADVSLGGQHTCARRTNGSLWCWGGNLFGQLGNGPGEGDELPTLVTALSPFIADVSLGGSHTCARKETGSLYCWGYDHYGQVGDGDDGTKSLPVLVPMPACP